ncbi:uncharacterized protein BROUX77_004199 [Berkeleyomyces rouxiae]|uniref:uncharacterized protein n=1 Tax=Berkeleyomyces rouxiae TaxID=2035830 RepID=UPI003B80A3D5
MPSTRKRKQDEEDEENEELLSLPEDGSEEEEEEEFNDEEDDDFDDDDDDEDQYEDGDDDEGEGKEDELKDDLIETTKGKLRIVSHKRKIAAADDGSGKGEKSEDKHDGVDDKDKAQVEREDAPEEGTIDSASVKNKDGSIVIAGDEEEATEAKPHVIVGVHGEHQ